MSDRRTAAVHPAAVSFHGTGQSFFFRRQSLFAAAPAAGYFPEGAHGAVALIAAVLVIAAFMFVGYVRRWTAAQRRLREREDFYKAAAEKGSDGIAFVRGGTIVFANERLGEMTRFGPAELAGTAFRSLTGEPGEDTGLPGPREISLAVRGGGALPAELRVAPVAGDGLPAQLCILRDISERKKAESERRRLASFAEINPNPIIELELSGSVCYVNKAAQRLFPEIAGAGLSHPFLADLPLLFDTLTYDDRRSLVREVKIGFHWYQQELYFVAADRRIRIYAYDVTARKRMEESLKNSEEKYRTLFETMLHGVAYQDAGGRVISANPAARRILGLTLSEMQENRFKAVHENFADFPEEEHPSKTALATGCEVRDVAMGIFNPVRKEYRWLNVTAVPQFRAGEERPYRVYTIFDDITEKKRAERELRDSEARYRRLFESTRDGILVLDAENGRILDANPFMAELLGFSHEELLKKTFGDIMKGGKASPPKLAELPGKEDAPYAHLALEARDGREIEAELVSTVYFIDHRKVIQCNIRDITERQQAERQIKYLSFHDKVTGLYNRTYFEEELRRLNTKREMPMSIIMGDVNNLKLVNDAFGHREGDRQLITIASILKSSCRNEDIVARWGGDEFIILLPRTDEKTAIEVAKRIRRDCQETRERPIRPAIALGIATKERAGQDIHEALKEAEDRMYRNKLMESKNGRSAIISSLLRTLRERSHETGQHTQRLRKFVTELGEALGLSDSQMDELSLLSVLHDIGKIAIPDEILMKPSPLSPKEWKTMMKHPEVGYRITQSFNALAHIADAILAHHERWDGTGYPQGLKKEEIPLIARILAIVDAFDVMTHGRSYAPPKELSQALEELRLKAGKQFDPELVDVFVGRFARACPPAVPALVPAVRCAGTTMPLQ